jgi:hypothetical protein
MRWILAAFFGAVIENKQTLPAGWKFIDDLHRSRGRQIAETLVEERSILISRLMGSDRDCSRLTGYSEPGIPIQLVRGGGVEPPRAKARRILSSQDRSDPL